MPGTSPQGRDICAFDKRQAILMDTTAVPGRAGAPAQGACSLWSMRSLSAWAPHHLPKSAAWPHAYLEQTVHLLWL